VVVSALATVGVEITISPAIARQMPWASLLRCGLLIFITNVLYHKSKSNIVNQGNKVKVKSGKV